MIQRTFHQEPLGLLGFGAMRLPLMTDGSGRVDEERTREMVDYAIRHGINYFDTAYPYHGGESERIMGKLLSAYPRGAYRLASKYPGRIVASDQNPARIFEEQLEKCRVDFFDFYLLHNVCETSLRTFVDD